MSNYQYCKNKAAADGSSLYYATLYEPKEKQKQIVALHAFLTELSEIIIECTDPGIAHIKYNWWQEEMQRLGQNMPRHPVSQTLSELIRFNAQTQLIFENSIKAAELLLDIEQAPTFTDALTPFQSSAGQIWWLANNQIERNKGAIINLGALIQFLDCLQHPHHFLNETRFIIPAEYCAEANRHALRTNENEQTALLTPLIKHIRDKLMENLNSISKADSKKLIHVMILSRISIALCDELVSEGCLLMNQRIHLTPICKLWIAWRTHARIRYF